MTFKTFTSDLNLLIQILLYIYSLGAKIKGSPVLSIKNFYFERNFGLENRTKIKKKKFGVRNLDFGNLWAKFCEGLKIRGYVTTTKVVNFFIPLAFLNCLYSEFFLLTGLKSLESLSLKLQIHFLVDSVQFFGRSYFTFNKKLILNFNARYIANQTT